MNSFRRAELVLIDALHAHRAVLILYVAVKIKTSFFFLSLFSAFRVCSILSPFARCCCLVGALFYRDCQASWDIECHCGCLIVILCVGYRGVITTAVFARIPFSPVLLASRGTQRVLFFVFVFPFPVTHTQGWRFLHPRHQRLSSVKDFNTIPAHHELISNK